MASVARKTRFQLDEENRITRNRERAIRWATRLAIVDLCRSTGIVWSRIGRGVVRDIGWSGWGGTGRATARESGWYGRLKGASIIAGVVADFETLLITVAIVFDRAPGFVERAVAALIVLVTTKIAGGVIGDVSRAGAKTV